MQVGAKFALRALPFHRGNHPVADHEAAQIRPACFLDEFLYQDTDLGAAECLDYGFGGLLRFSQDNADALCAFQQFDHDRRAADFLDNFFHLLGVVGEYGYRQTDPAAGK